MSKFFFTSLFCLAIASAHAQSYPLEGTWTLQSAQVNFSEKGMSQPVHTLDSQEIQEAAIPAELVFGNTNILRLQGEDKPLDYSLNDKIVSLRIPDQAQTVYTGWIENGQLLVVMSEYKGRAFQANEIRVVYKKVNPEQ